MLWWEHPWMIGTFALSPLHLHMWVLNMSPRSWNRVINIWNQTVYPRPRGWWIYTHICSVTMFLNFNICIKFCYGPKWMFCVDPYYSCLSQTIDQACTYVLSRFILMYEFWTKNIRWLCSFISGSQTMAQTNLGVDYISCCEHVRLWSRLLMLNFPHII